MTDFAPKHKELRTEIVELLPRLRRFCTVLMRSADGGDDLCQSVVEKALAHEASFEQGTRLDSWMYRIARNTHIDLIRRQSVRGFPVNLDDAAWIAGDDGVAIVEGRSDLACAEHAVSALPEDQRCLIALVVMDGKSYREAADILEIPIGTVMSRIARARQAIDRHVNRPVVGQE